MKITLMVGGAERIFLAAPTARKTRDAYFLREKIREKMRNRGDAAGFDEETTDEMLRWVVDVFDRQFTADEFLDGYAGWFFDILNMMDVMLASVTEEMHSGFPRPPEKTAANR